MAPVGLEPPLGMTYGFLPWERNALAIRRKMLGQSHPLVAQSLDNYAALMLQTDRATEGRRLQILASSIRAYNARANLPRAAESSEPKKSAVHILKTTN